MKGTLFSADFIKDSNDNLRLLEINTDTAFTSGALAQTNFDSFINIISSSNITSVDVIYKERIHSNFVEQLSQSLASSDVSPSLNLHVEEFNTIYPTVIADAADKFILRCAYDESAIFDSEYCKHSDQALKLFYDNNDTGSVPAMYHSSSDYFIDNLDESVNGANIPDLVEKGRTDGTLALNLYKLPGTGSVSENFTAYKSNLSTDKFVVNYYNNSGSTSKSYRSFNIIYGTDLSIVNLANVEVEAILEKPTALDVDSVSGLIDDKHYYEFTTNYPRFYGIGGLFEDDEITDVNGNAVKAKDVIVGNEYKSTYVNGAPDTDSAEVFTAWSHSGSSLPSGSYTTSSVLVGKTSQGLHKKIIQHVQTVGSASFRVHPSQHLLVYDSNQDALVYKQAYDLDTSIDSLIGASGSNESIASSSLEVLEEDYDTFVLDMEPNDTFVLHNGDLNIKIVTHNCFPAGTQITLEDGSQKNIEDLTVEDRLLTYNKEAKKYNSGTIGSIQKTTQNILIEISIDNGVVIKATPKHKFFCCGEKWTSAEDLEVGNTLTDVKGNSVKIESIKVLKEEVEVYHIIDVKDDHTYFAEGLLVHNFKFTFGCFPGGTNITLANGSTKVIEKVEVGDLVLTYNENTGEQEVNAVYEVHAPVHNDLVEYSLSDGNKIISTFDHPLYVNGLELASYYPEKTNDNYELDREVVAIKVGDVLKTVDGEDVIIEKIEEQEEVDTQTYILRVNNNHNFYANNILVHNK